MNDLHSKFENMPKIATYIKQLKVKTSKTEEKVIAVDIGDHMDRMRIETEGTGGKVNVDILNQTGVEFVTLGNNEGLTFTKELLKEAYQKRQFKIVACNLRDITTNERPEWIDEFWIQEIDGVKIGWLGATAPYETFYHLQGWNVTEPVPLLKKITNEIRNEVDIIILLSHLGLKADKIISEEIPEIDIILGGHTHRLFEHGIKNENQPLICQVGIFGDQIGHLTIEYDKSKKQIKKMQENLIKVSDYKDAPEILEVLRIGKEKAKKKLNQVVVELTTDIPVYIDTESPLPNLLADGVRNWVGAKVAFINSGQFIAGLKKGLVTNEKVHEICPSPINVCRVTLQGKQLKETLEQSLLDEFIHYPMRGFGFRGDKLGTLAVSGMKIYYDNSRPDYHKIKEIWIGESLLKDDEIYEVATLDMFTFGGGYPIIKEGKDIQYFLPEFIRDIITSTLTNQDLIEESFKYRWFLTK